jgi:rieske iron-sulfur protein
LTAGLNDRTNSADGIVACLAICTHAQCPVTGWLEDEGRHEMPCHNSDYDPRQDGKVTPDTIQGITAVTQCAANAMN